MKLLSEKLSSGLLIKNQFSQILSHFITDKASSPPSKKSFAFKLIDACIHSVFLNYCMYEITAY
jgi:hypothetical protein